MNFTTIKQVVIAVSFVLAACSAPSFSDKDKLWNYIKDPSKGYLQTKVVNGYKYSLLYKPTDLLVQQELGSEVTDKKVRKVRNKYKQYLYFTLSMSKNEQELLSTVPNNKQEFGTMVHALAFGMINKVHLFTSKRDTLEMLDYHYPRMYGMSRATTLLFVYPRNKKYLKDEYLTFTVADLGTYTGEVKFTIAVNKIKYEPMLKL
ncbi:MAG: hypothetical protein ACK5H1_08945 [Tenacibaculum sp.]